MSNGNLICVAMETIQLHARSALGNSLLSSSFAERFCKGIVGDLQLCYLFVLVCCHSDKGCLGKVPHKDGFGRGSGRGTFLVLFNN